MTYPLDRLALPTLIPLILAAGFFIQFGMLIILFKKMRALRKLVKKLHAERETQAARLSRSWKTAAGLESLGFYSAAVLHNIAGPVSTLNSLVYEVSQQLSNQQRKNIDACLRYISTVIRHSQRDITQEPLPPEDIYIGEIFEEVHDIVHSVAIRQRITLLYECDPTLFLRGDITFFRQMILNVVQNSIEAMAETTRGAIRLVARKKSNAILVTVTDTGPGMPKEQLAKIGTKFFTVKKNRSGLGAAFVKETVERHFHGTCTYSSRLKKGTTVALTLPITPTVY